jgi:uncharacterized repeat protein (TIGR03806 family)
MRRLFFLVLTACASSPSESTTTLDYTPFPDRPPTLLSETGLFAAGTTPSADATPYELSTALFSDGTIKRRAIHFPPKTAATYDARETFDFPIGTVITKTFFMRFDATQPSSAPRALETRLLVRRAAGWEAFPYVWNEEQTDAKLAPGGRVIPIERTEADGTIKRFSYLVPSKNQCQVCHHVLDGGTQKLLPIGPKARHLDVGDQLDRWARDGKLNGLPPRAERPPAIDAFDPAVPIEARARTYLDINCAHCHRERATVGQTTRLFLDIANTDPFHLGVCKRPGSAGPGVGGTFDLVPGSHDTSILWFRMQTEESGKMMPSIGRATRHAEGAALLAAWIDAMPPRACE